MGGCGRDAGPSLVNPVRVLSISMLFPNPARPLFGIFVGNQMRAVTRDPKVDLTMISPIGLPPWPLSRREPYRSLATVPLEAEIMGLAVRYPRFRLIPKLGGDSNPGRIVSALLPLIRRLHAAQPFALVDAQFFFPEGPAAAAIARELGLPLSIKSRGADIHYWGKRPAALRQMLAAARQAAGMLAVSEALRRDMIALGMPADRIRVHYTGLDRDRFKPTGRGEARERVSALPGFDGWIGEPLLVSPGALIPRKGQRLAIEALVALPGVHLALAGAGEDEASLRALAARLGLARRVHFLGQISHEVLPLLLSAADVVVLPSASEGLANVWVEALACGTPIVITDVGGAREIVREPTAGRLVARDSASIADAVSEILADPPTQERVAANAAQFSWENNAAELVRFWNCVVADELAND